MNFIKKIFYPIGATLKYIQEHFKAMLFVLLLFLIFAPTEEANLNPVNLQEIKLVGPIFDATDVVQKIDKARENPNIRGVLLDVNSPGGAVAPSVEIAYAIKRLKEVKPVIVYASGTLASGSYYASIWASEIMVNPGSMVGSIGVVMQGADVSELMSKIGIKSQSVQAGKYKKVGTGDRAWTKYEVDELNKVIYGTYDMFTKDVADARGLKFKNRDEFANAHIFTASQAKDVGLIDSLGVKYDAKKKVQALSGVAFPEWSKEDKFDKLMKKLAAEASASIHMYFPELTLR
ncbi:signal peptide peptidase SppA [Sulfurimonas lithotrophica]|uniref:Signal peptide peptidase SppA n=1 Tax=Sulfurimonas lithotrophica TaxID=2590022 RepID=A0A5P8P1V0_9BACT|nr:signal peptide peptidase SppA [Sulfurimonas lithotrophica]QFR49601.1 signal peptide peptidase SppA [Sulfurimonas lithotrophica]